MKLLRHLASTRGIYNLACIIAVIASHLPSSEAVAMTEPVATNQLNWVAGDDSATSFKGIDIFKMPCFGRAPREWIR